jgi:hypothetical protein
MRSCDSVCSSRTESVVAPACLTALASASATTKYGVLPTVGDSGPSTSTTTRLVGSGTRSTRSSTASASPRSIKSAGITAWTSSRRWFAASSMPLRSCVAAASRSAAERAWRSSCAPMASRTSSTWMPSCRFWAMRRRSRSPASTIRARESRNAAWLAMSSAVSRSLSMAMAATRPADCTSSGSSFIARSYTSAPMRRSPNVISAMPRPVSRDSLITERPPQRADERHPLRGGTTSTATMPYA